MAVERQPTALPWDYVDGATIVRATVGSTVHGTAVEGTDDRDEMGVCIEPPAWVIGLRHFEQHVRRDRPEGVRSRPGDLDLVVYGLRKYCSLALKGNPSVLLLLMVPDEDCMAGERGQMNVKRPELVEAYGFDTKYAAHIVRLGYQGIDYMTTGRFPVPMPEDQRDEILRIRTGQMDENDVLTLAGELQHELRDAVAGTPLPPEPDRAAVDAFLEASYRSFWNSRRFVDLVGRA